MTKHIPVCKHTTGNHEQDAEEESFASEGKTETVGKSTGKEAVGKPAGKEAVGKPAGKTPDTQNVWDITETVTEKRTMEEIPPNTREQIPRRLSPIALRKKIYRFFCTTTASTLPMFNFQLVLSTWVQGHDDCGGKIVLSIVY